MRLVISSPRRQAPIDYNERGLFYLFFCAAAFDEQAAWLVFGL